MEPKQGQQERPELPSGTDQDAPSSKDIYIYLVILLGALLITAMA
jgi:hypothetical protein